jgi:chlorobactene glucosyltransferase
MVSLKKPRHENLPGPAPLVSILIPARNEENNIRPCLESLLKQDYPNFEIIVLDDSSTDATPLIVSGMANTDNRIRLLQGKSLPKGWTGKSFACFQAAREAHGEWLLFVDADTRHESDMLAKIIPFAVKSGVSLLSGFPHQITTSLIQKITVPMMYFVLMCWAPFWWLHRSKRLPPSVAYGAFLLFDAQAYWNIGGHEAVKSRILEDVWLGVEISRHGGRHMAVDLSEVVSCHMYHDAGSIWEGFTKWMYSVSAISTPALVLLIVIGYTTLLSPFYWLCKAFWVMQDPPAWAILTLLQVLLLFAMRYIVDRRFGESRLSFLLYPVSIIFLIAVVIYGMVRQLTGAGVSWKNRVYGKASDID